MALPTLDDLKAATDAAYEVSAELLVVTGAH